MSASPEEPNATAPLPVHSVVQSGLSTVRASNRAGTSERRSIKSFLERRKAGVTARRDGTNLRWERAKPCCIYCGAPDVDGLFDVVADRWRGTEDPRSCRGRAITRSCRPSAPC